MVLNILRFLFILLMAAVGWWFLTNPSAINASTWMSMMLTLIIGVIVVCIDVLSPRTKLAVFSGTFLGLVVGLLTAFAMTFVVKLVLDQIAASFPTAAAYFATPAQPGIASITNRIAVEQFINLVVGIICCYFAISFILQTRDDFRFIIPYVEFSKQTKGARPILLDTSVLIDGRITDIASTGILESQLVIPRFVLDELQAVADSADKLKRNRGRRGLDVVANLQANRKVDVILYDSSARDEHESAEVDQRLMSLAQELSARVLTNDFNLNKVAQLRGVDVINLNDLGNALKPVVLPGEKMSVRLIKPGEEPGQGVGYLEDGTMIVVEQGRQHLNEEVEFTVTSVLQTSAGRMIFGRAGDAPQPVGGPQGPHHRRRGTGVPPVK